LNNTWKNVEEYCESDGGGDVDAGEETDAVGSPGSHRSENMRPLEAEQQPRRAQVMQVVGGHVVRAS
jgi:hypothetical protein